MRMICLLVVIFEQERYCVRGFKCEIMMVVVETTTDLIYSRIGHLEMGT
jgi:hypothetical protein